VAEAALDRVTADRSYCLLYDAGRETLWARDPTSASRRDESAAVGLVSFVLRSGLPARLAHAGTTRATSARPTIRRETGGSASCRAHFPP